MFEEELPREIARARRSDTPLSIAWLDLDHMSAFNMLRGEGEGDRLVKETAARAGATSCATWTRSRAWTASSSR